ncbi:hypothetical protein JEY40_26595 [Bradyrhizobium japonicum]|uniref:hypothetical protein n=1 Tax=Bradyrhizobium japonicum TaxID=375 RepID=UPI00200BDF64|nr:hypothetical protein [Bradyrhizobium japonicum]UQD69573.1 hypothetical protein JEY40_26595 [Bradyrhizobium japonicum]
MSADLEQLREQIISVEKEVMEKTRAVRLAEGALRITQIRRHDLHEQYRAAFAADDALRHARAC